ncbi:menaquinone biosynthesis protein [soil metagenome]
MNVPRISASSYSNTAPLIWSFLYGSMHGSVEIILDNAPARSAELLAQDRVDAALVPVIAYQMLSDVRLIPAVCVGAKERVRSFGLITRGMDLEDVRSVSLDTSSKTSVVLTKILFREFLGFDPEWRDAPPNLETMLDETDCALLIGDPALGIADSANAERGTRNAEFDPAFSSVAPVRLVGAAANEATFDDTQVVNNNSALRIPHSAFRKFDLAELWNRHTGLGFVFAMWMTRRKDCRVDFAAARDEGMRHIPEIAANYEPEIGLTLSQMTRYLSECISYSVDESMQRGMELYFELASKCRLIETDKPIRYLELE